MWSGHFLSEEFQGMSKVTYVPEGYKGFEELENMISKAYRKFYLRPRYLYKSIRRIHSFTDIKEFMQGS
jgi:hypothetical protein